MSDAPPDGVVACFNYNQEAILNEVDISKVHERLAFNTGNILFLDAMNEQIRWGKQFSDFEEIRTGVQTAVLSMGNWLSPHADLSWQAECLENSQVEKCVVVGLGAQSQANMSEITLLPGTRRFLDIVAERSVTLGVRGDYTADVLESLGVHNVDVIGCPSLFAKMAPSRDIGKDGIRLSVNSTFHGHYRDAIAELLGYGQRQGAQFLEQSEIEMMQYASLGKLTSYVNFLAHYYSFTHNEAFEKMEWWKAKSAYFTDRSAWIESMEAIDLAIGSRFHGNVAALYGGARALMLVMDTRTKELAEYYNFPHMKFEDFDSSKSLEHYYEKADPELFQSTLPDRLSRYKAFLLKNGLELSTDFSGELPDAPEVEPRGSLDGFASYGLKRFSADAQRLPLTEEVVTREQSLRSKPLRTLEEGAKIERADPLLTYAQKQGQEAAPPSWFKRQHLPDGYKPQREPVAYSDKTKKEEWQRTVYVYAARLAERNNIKSVVDFGCGSAFKLRKYFSHIERTGVDIGDTLEYLRTTYPDERWVDGSIIHPSLFDADMVICSDVIEHLFEPDLLLAALAASKAKIFVLSTPALELLTERDMSVRLGPPTNLGHIFEWTTVEFEKLVSDHMRIEAHIISNLKQATQTCIAVKRDGAKPDLPELLTE